MTDHEKSPESRSADEEMSRKEKEELLEQVEQFEGPDRREIRGSEPENDPGVSHS